MPQIAGRILEWGISAPNSSLWISIAGWKKIASWIKELDIFKFLGSNLFSFGVWILWQHRNRVIFKNFTPNQNIYKEIVQKAAKFAYCAQNMAASKLQVEKYLQWERPHRGWFKLKY